MRFRILIENLDNNKIDQNLDSLFLEGQNVQFEPSIRFDPDRFNPALILQRIYYL